MDRLCLLKVALTEGGFRYILAIIGDCFTRCIELFALLTLEAEVAAPFLFAGFPAALLFGTAVNLDCFYQRTLSVLVPNSRLCLRWEVLVRWAGYSADYDLWLPCKEVMNTAQMQRRRAYFISYLSPCVSGSILVHVDYP
jgi:hypothetical protein